MTETPQVTDRREPVDLQDEIQKSYLDYAMSVIVGRALPDVRDGLKPVHRRILYAMHDGGYRPDRGWNKCARVVGEVMGQYHPHGDGAIYDTLVRLAQPWVMRYPLVSGQGNFGSPGNDPAAAMRYTECKMAPLANEMVRDIAENTVDFKPNYDGKESEPVVLPARFPNLLVNGSTGIAVGMATNIPTHNLREVASAVQWSLEHPEATSEELLEAAIERVKGPDFPNGALIVGRRGIEDAYRTGRGSVIMRAVVNVEEDRGGRTHLVVTELPHMVNPDNLALKIAELVNTGKLNGIADIRDNTSARTGQQLVIVLKRDAQPRVVLNNLYKHTQLQDTFGCNMLALVDDVPRTLRLDQFISYWIAHQIEVIQRRTQHRLEDAEARAHIYRGLVKALDALDEVIALIRRSPSTDEAREGLKSLLDIDDLQANAILDMQLRRLAQLERQRIVDQLAEFERIIADLEDILATSGAPARHRQGRARGDRRALRRRPAYADHRRRRRPVRRGPRPRRARRDHDQPGRLRQAHDDRPVPRAEARGDRRPGRDAAGRRRGRAPLRHVHPPLDPVLHQQGPGLPRQGVDAARGRPRRPRRARGRAAVVPARRGDRPGARRARLRGVGVPAARHAARPGQEDRAEPVRLAAPGGDHRGELPRRGRRAHRGRPVRPERRGAAHLDEGAGDPLPRERRGAAPDGPRDLRRHGDEVPSGRRAAVDVDHPDGGVGGGPLRLHRHRRRLRQADGRRGVPAAGPWRAGHQGHEARRGARLDRRRRRGQRGRRGHRAQGQRPDHPQPRLRGGGQGSRHDGREVRRRPRRRLRRGHRALPRGHRGRRRGRRGRGGGGDRRAGRGQRGRRVRRPGAGARGRGPRRDRARAWWDASPRPTPRSRSRRAGCSSPCGARTCR